VFCTGYIGDAGADDRLDMPSKANPS